MEKLNFVIQFNNLKIQGNAFNYVRIALREISNHRIKSDKAREYRQFKLLETFLGRWHIFKLSATKERLNYNLAHHFRTRTLMRKLLAHLRASNDLFARVYCPEKIAIIYEQNLQNKAFQTL